MNRRLFLTLPILACLAAACASTTASSKDSADYVLVYLKTGPLSAAKTDEEQQQIFSGHMANMQRLAEERTLLIAGPFEHPSDASWRGIFVLDVPTLAQARAVVDTDPGVQAQVFSAELVPLRASNALRKTPDLERARKSALAASDKVEPDPTGFDVRGYVMITAKDGARAQRTLKPLAKAGKLVWSGLLDGERAGQGVFVLDAETVEQAEGLLKATRAKLGECSIDAWWSANSLAQLAQER